MPNAANHLYLALDEKQQLQQRQEQRHHPFEDFRHPSGGNGQASSSRSNARRYSSTPRGVGEPSLTSIREVGRRRTNSAPPEIEAVAAAAAAAAVWNRYGSAPGGTRHRAADSKRILYEHEDREERDEAFEPFSHEAPEEETGDLCSLARRVVTGEDGGRRAGVESTVAGNDVPSRAHAGPGVGVARRLSATLPGASLSPRVSSSTSPLSPRSPRQQSSTGVAFPGAVRGGDSGHRGGGKRTPAAQPPSAESRREIRLGSRSSSQRIFSEFSRREGPYDAPIRNGGRRRVSSAGGTGEGGANKWAVPAGGQRPRRNGASMYTDRSAQAERRADIERVLRCGHACANSGKRRSRDWTI